MSITGEPDRPPMKVGVGIADVMCGMYATVAILAALNHREKTHEGQYIDLSLLDSQVAWLVNVGLNYLTSKQVPQRIGNEHPNIVPYNVLPSSDGFIILAVGNDAQFRKFCEFAGAPELAQDARCGHWCLARLMAARAARTPCIPSNVLPIRQMI